MGMSLEQIDSSRQTYKAAPASPRTANDPPIPDVDVGKAIMMEKKPATTAEGAVPMAQDQQERIALAAYYKAEQRGFESGHEMEDWLAAECQINSESV